MTYDNQIIVGNLRLSRAIIANRNKMLAPLGLTSSQAEALIYILKKGKEKEVTVADMVEHFSLTHQTISGIISRLIEKGFIYKQKSKLDSRCFILLPTVEGKKIDNLLRKHAQETQNQMMESFTEQEISQYLSFLNKARENLLK